MAQDESCGATRTIRLIKRIRSTVNGINKTHMKSALLAMCFVFFSFDGAFGSHSAVIVTEEFIK
jgi:hypothetical protein